MNMYPLIYYVSLNYYGFCISQYNKCVLCIVYVCVCKRARYKEGGMVGAHEVSRYYGDIPLPWE